MSLPVAFRHEASQDTEEARDYYNRAQQGLGETFPARLTETVARVRTMPEMYAVVWQDVRAVQLRKFPYVAYYRILADRIEVLAVMHGRRDQSAWQERV